MDTRSLYSPEIVSETGSKNSDAEPEMRGRMFFEKSKNVEEDIVATDFARIGTAVELPSNRFLNSSFAVIVKVADKGAIWLITKFDIDDVEAHMVPVRAVTV